MNKSPLVTVVLPVYNEEKYIAHSLSSLIAQTYRKIEIIVVDDGSTDKSLHIAKTFNVQIVKQRHKGAGAARNNGAKRARGSVLVFPDADMRYDKKYVENLIKPIVQKKAIGTFNKDEFVANPENIWARCWAINSGLPYDRHSSEDLSNEQNIFRAITKKAFQKTNGFDSEKGYFDDTSLAKELGTQAISAKGAIAYHYNPESLSEVYYSARWIGRGGRFDKSLYNLIRFSPLNSLRVSLSKIIHRAPLHFIIFKLVYDFGMLQGVFFSSGKKEK